VFGTCEVIVRLDTMQEMSTLKLYSTDSTVPGKFAEYTVSLKGNVP
jgi:hypothetical protein